MSATSTGSSTLVPLVQNCCDSSILRAAEAICENRLRRFPESTVLLHLRGLLAAEAQHDEVALACLSRAAVDSIESTCLVDFGDVLSRNGRVDEAAAAYLRAIALGAREPGVYCRLAHALTHRGRVVEAAAMCREALRLEPTYVSAHKHLGDLLLAENRCSEALVHYRSSVELAPTDCNAYQKLGQVYMSLQEPKKAIECFRQGLRLQPKCADLHVDLGQALLSGGAPSEATESFRIALNITPRDVRACRLFVCALESVGRLDEAVGAWFNLGRALECSGRLQEAATAYRHALARKPDCLRALVKLGQLNILLGEPKEAVRRLEAAVALDPGHTLAHVRLGWALDCLGEFERAWDEFQWYNGMGHKRELEQPIWDGSHLNGRTILLWADLALGDALRDIRYARLVKALGGRVVVECPRSLVSLIERCDGVDSVIARGAPLPALDVHAPLLSLPRIFGTRHDTIPRRVPYCCVDDQLKGAWSRKLGSSDVMTIGIVWASERSRWQAPIKSVSLAAFAPLASVQHARFISLQLGSPASELHCVSHGLEIDEILDDSCDIADTAALIMNLDLVITVDTMVAHLAGALAKPVWTLVAYAPASWLWHSQDGTSLWYPTMRLFRQTRMSDWTDVIASIAAALAIHVRTFAESKRLSA